MGFQIVRLKSKLLDTQPHSPALYQVSIEINQQISRLELGKPDWERVKKLLNGSLYRAVQSDYSRSRRRSEGVFFTSPELADKALSLLSTPITHDSVVYDPCCGGGDLLLAAARKMLGESYNGHQCRNVLDVFTGADVNDEFVSIAKRRLHLLNLFNKLQFAESGSDDKKEPLITRCDFYSQTERWNATHVVLNPPYNRVSVGNDSNWSAGSVSAAAYFVVRSLELMKPGAELVAILPDSLRSGSRYRAWRERIENMSSHVKIRLYDQFSEVADVHVFVLFVRKKSDDSEPIKKLVEWYPRAGVGSEVLSDKYRVSVGNVVDFRDPHSGAEVPFLKSGSVRQLHDGISVKDKRCWDGVVHSPPFIVVRRTSRPGDYPRAAGAVVPIGGPYAVENHLLVIKGKSDSYDDIRKLNTYLRSDGVSEWLDERIRCRHLTVEAIKELPVDL